MTAHPTSDLKAQQSAKTAFGGRFLKREEVRQLLVLAREGNVEAACELLRHSCLCGHAKLAMHRYFLAISLGASLSGQYHAYCAEVAKSLGRDVVLKIRSQYFPGEI